MTWEVGSLPWAPVAFDPMSIDWKRAFWASGPEFAALGLADGAAVATWPDEMNAGDATQATAGSRPTYDAAHASFNNRPVVAFDGTDDFMTTALFTVAISGTSETVVIGRSSAATVGQFFIAGTDATKRRNLQFSLSANGWGINGGIGLSGGVANANPHYFRVAWSNLGDTLNVDGTQIINGDAGNENMTGIRLGSYPTGQYLNGEIAFAAVINRVLTDDERAALLVWTRDFYGTP